MKLSGAAAVEVKTERVLSAADDLHMLAGVAITLATLASLGGLVAGAALGLMSHDHRLLGAIIAGGSAFAWPAALVPLYAAKAFAAYLALRSSDRAEDGF